jgi:2-hydroxychromene-2-carboxylate isomerase
MKSIETYFDYASPWAYLASELMPRKLPSLGAAIIYRPIYLRGLESFAKGAPYSSSKLAYLMRDLARCAEHEGVTLTPPPVFPIDGLHALRGAVVAQDSGAFDRYHRAAFRAAWADGRDINKVEVVGTLLAEALGSSETTALEAMSVPTVKDRLREATAAAEARGVFGVPTFFVGDEMFWGHDRFDYVARAARGARDGKEG